MTQSRRSAGAPPHADKLQPDKGRLYSTSEGRARFPDILQSSYGDKAVVGFGRYGRALGALVPMEAVRLLAGFDESVDEDVRKRIIRTARSLLQRVPAEAELCGLEDAEDPQLREIEDIDRDRRAGKSRTRPRGRSAAS